MPRGAVLRHLSQKVMPGSCTFTLCSVLKLQGECQHFVKLAQLRCLGFAELHTCRRSVCCPAAPVAACRPGHDPVLDSCFERASGCT